MKIGYYGIVGAYSYVAASKLFKSQELIGLNSPDTIIDSVLSGKIDFGVIPIENSIAGRVDQTHNALLKYKDIKVIREYILPIKHCLIGRKMQSMSDIRSAYSHPQALMQCSQFLDKHNIQTFVSDTADGVKMVSLSNDSSIAGIASQECAEIYNCEVIAKDINNEFNNFTKFIVVSKNYVIPDYNNSSDYTTIIIIKLKNQIGSLASILNIIMNRNINITSIESYIPGALPSQSADFFFKIDGHISDDKILQGIYDIKSSEMCLGVSNLGTYENYNDRII